jgi:MFS family permease
MCYTSKNNIPLPVNLAFWDSTSMLKEAQSKTNLQAWLIVAACFTATLVIGGTFHSLGVFFKPLEEELASSRTLISSGYTTFMIGVAISSIVAGKLVDRFNARPILLVCAGLEVF